MIFALLLFLALVILWYLFRKASGWFGRIAASLEAIAKDDNTKDYLESTAKEERGRKEKIKREVHSSKYLTSEYLVRRDSTDRNSKADQVKVEQFLRNLDSDPSG